SSVRPCVLSGWTLNPRPGPETVQPLRRKLHFGGKVMTTGLSREQARKKVYGQCRTIKRRLERAGVPVGYRKGQLFHTADAHGGFVVCFHRIDATNGETSLLCEIVVDGPEGWEEFDFLCAEQGLA